MLARMGRQSYECRFIAQNIRVKEDNFLSAEEDNRLMIFGRRACQSLISAPVLALTLQRGVYARHPSSAARPPSF